MMLGEDELAEIEGDAARVLRLTNDGEAPPVLSVCLALTGRAPLERPGLRGEGVLEDGQAFLRPGLSEPRKRFALAHECGHFIYPARTNDPAIEAWCDAFAAAIVCPWGPFLRLTRRIGHRVYELAERFGVTQSVSLLRIGETEGRPSMLLCESGPLIRGRPFAWPSSSTLSRALRAGRSEVHPVALRDEPNRVGLLASRGAWSALSA